MIFVFLCVVIAFITITDLSGRWLDSETQNILYYDTEADPTESSEQEPADDLEGSSKSTEDTGVSSDSAVTKDTGAPDDSAVTRERIKSESLNAADFEQDILNEMTQALNHGSSKQKVQTTDLCAEDLESELDLDSYDFDSDEDETKIDGSAPQSDDEVKRDAQDVFERFKSRHE